MNKKQLFLIFIISKFLFLSYAKIGSSYVSIYPGYLGQEVGPNLPFLIWSLANFDGRHFINIANLGYHGFNFVYFPLYPLLIYLTQKLTNLNFIYSGLIVTNLATILSFFVLYLLVLKDFNKKLATLSVLILAVFPTSFFLHSVYSTSLSLLLLTSSFYFARNQKWFFASILAAFATATHISGLAIVPALITEWYIQSNYSHSKLLKFMPYGLISSLGITSYLTYQKIIFNDPLLFLKSFSAWHRNSLTFPIQVIYRYLKILLVVDTELLVYWVALLELVITVSLVSMSIYIFKKIRLSYAVLIFSIVLLSSLSGSLIGSPRYIVFTFPFFIGLAQIIDNKARVQIIIFTAFIVLGFILTTLFTNGHFIS